MLARTEGKDIPLLATLYVDGKGGITKENDFPVAVPVDSEAEFNRTDVWMARGERAVQGVRVLYQMIEVVRDLFKFGS